MTGDTLTANKPRCQKCGAEGSPGDLYMPAQTPTYGAAGLELRWLCKETAACERRRQAPVLAASEPDPQALRDALYAAIRAELDDSLAFIAGCKQLPRRQRRPHVGPTVRDYLADQIAWKALAVFDGDDPA